MVTSWYFIKKKKENNIKVEVKITSIVLFYLS